MSQICGNKTTVEKLTEWLKKWYVVCSSDVFAGA